MSEKYSTSKEWFRSRAHLEAGQEIGAGSELAAALLACHWNMRDAALVKTGCGELLSAQVENFAFTFCGYCGRPIAWQANN